MHQVCAILNRLVAVGTKQEQELATRLLHEIEDEVCKGKWADSTAVSKRTQPHR